MDRIVSRCLVVGVLGIATLAGCGGCSSAGPGGATQLTAPTVGPPVAQPAVPSAPVFDVHEWGLVDVTPAAARLLTGPPSGPTNWDAPRRKPVLYFHLADGTPALDASVTVSLANGALVEHFPRGDVTSEGRVLTWPAVHVRREGCHVAGAPTRESTECATPDGVCEAAELARYETADASCVDFRGAAFNHLFYRANGLPPPLPFDVTVQGNQLTILHARASDVVGPILYVHNDVGTVTVSTIAPPALGQSVTAAPPTGTDVAGAQQVLRATMQQVGLTPEEIGAFDRAWDNDLFGRGAARDMPARRASTGPEDYLLFAMPASLLDGASRVTITPAPRTLKRFLLVRLAV